MEKKKLNNMVEKNIGNLIDRILNQSRKIDQLILCCKNNSIYNNII